MTSALAPGLDGAGLALLAGAAVVAGLVRGFAGFGSALIFMPFAGMVLPPFSALAVLATMDLVGPIPNLPRAWREGAPKEVAWMGLGLIATLPLGYLVLAAIPVAAFRTAVSLIALALLGLLISGWRHDLPASRPVLSAAGAVSGFLTGSTGIAGPPVILFLMAGRRTAADVRANLLLYLFLVDVGTLALMALVGRLSWSAVLVGAGLIVPFTLANIAGAAMFRPGRERLYRRIANVIIAASALAGLPIWGG
ncbi:TSUP family transporter [Acidimangrovimonas pyrenivorans]|uniref:Probable membrane transporter protein n=1 Tax=Acidimangrovimonas pyrenivorans TaxID=2030798 RepID=A0ABV7AJ74_9RHOB